MAVVASGNVEAKHCHLLSTGGMLSYARRSDACEFVVTTETGMLYPLRTQNPAKRFIPVNPTAVCECMKLITLPKLRGSLLDLKYDACVAPEVAARARMPIERMVAIT